MIVCYEDNPKHSRDKILEALMQAALSHFSAHSAKIWKTDTDVLRVFKLSSRSAVEGLLEKASRKGLLCTAMAVNPTRSEEEEADAAATAMNTENDDEVIFDSDPRPGDDNVAVWVLGPVDSARLDATRVRLEFANSVNGSSDNSVVKSIAIL
uniref:Uncharacterized protein n=2 Tax=Lotharella oceanica TaxID=641309 RepID=A0A7S2XG64_9EUKA|mmetsp:Transcript_6159/g.12319  ORF Transcript_6159/g.12319 Transcript_6159/m.12319 type:complete len:153 (+) Transcript_6159:66-524(+)